MGLKTAITWEGFLAAGEEGQRWEWVDGEVEFMSPGNLRHEAFLMMLSEALSRYCRLHPEWICFGSNAVFSMSSGNWRMPDASLVRKSRFPAGEFPVRADFPPDVAFEVHSPTDTPSQIQRKRKDYQESGVVQVWFDLTKRLVELIYPDQPLQYFGENQTLVIDTVPSFALALGELYKL